MMARAPPARKVSEVNSESLLGLARRDTGAVSCVRVDMPLRPAVLPLPAVVTETARQHSLVLALNTPREWQPIS